jgi:hypothetical protein
MNLSRVAAKQLTASDLTLFAAQYHKPGQRSKQKAINLNADVFVSRFYPGLRDRFAELHFGLTIVGPGAAPPYIVSRKALRTEGAKNWRLDGELINDPADQPGRFDTLAEGDIAILAFEGSEQPEQVTLVLISATADALLHDTASRLAGFQGRETMRPIDEGSIRALLGTTRANYPAMHPLESLLTADSVEEAIYGPVEAHEAAAQSDGRGVAISPESIRRQATNAGETGQLGEEAFERWLINSGHIDDDFEWVSQTHGRAAFDFEVANPHWERATEPLYIDVKATRGSYEAPFHMSIAELRWAADHPGYRIARVSALTSSSGDVDILVGVCEIAIEILQGLDGTLPLGVKVDSVGILPSVLNKIHSAHVEWSVED